MIRRISLPLVCITLVSFARAETIILKDGTFIDGEITLRTSQTVRVQSIYGERTYKLRDIEEILETVDYADPESVERFEQLPKALQAVLNARADYNLGNHDRALSRLEPHLDYDENQAVRNSLDWLVIEIYERKGQWEEAKTRLEDKVDKGNPREKLRAEAHLDIFKRNPDYDLRYVGTKQARNFLVIADKELRYRAREPNSLMDREVMDAALAEYCEQLLRAEGFSVGALEESMNRNKTFEALRDLKPGGNVEERLPYIDMLKRAEQSISKAQAVLPGYGSIYELQLVRVEITHLYDVWEVIAKQVLEASPQQITPAFDPQTGYLTKEGRERLIAQCEEFITQAEQLITIIEYVQTKAERYPRKLDSPIKLHNLVIEHHKNMIHWARRLRQKTHV